MDPIRSIDWSRQALLSDGDPLNSGVVRGGKKGMVGHSAWHLEFLRDLAEASGHNRTIITFFSQIIKKRDR
jgi:hypothetical protein